MVTQLTANAAPWPLLGRMIGSSESFIRQTYRDPTQIDDARMRLTLIHREVERWDEAMWAYLQEWGTVPDGCNWSASDDSAAGACAHRRQ
ncbi:MAG: hypothetical protein R3E79_07815 [Caldilineaceae bacterium]